MWRAYLHINQGKFHLVSGLSWKIMLGSTFQAEYLLTIQVRLKMHSSSTVQQCSHSLPIYIWGVITQSTNIAKMKYREKLLNMSQIHVERGGGGGVLLDQGINIGQLSNYKLGRAWDLPKSLSCAVLCLMKAKGFREPTSAQIRTARTFARSISSPQKLQHEFFLWQRLSCAHVSYVQ